MDPKNNVCVFSFFVHFFLLLSHCKLQSAIKFSPSLCLAIFPPAREIKLYFGWNFACALQLQIMSLSTSPIVLMVIRKYSVGHLDNAQQKVQFVKLLGSANTHTHTHTHAHTHTNTEEYHILTRTKQFYKQRIFLSSRSLISTRLLALWRTANAICIFYAFVPTPFLLGLTTLFYMETKKKSEGSTYTDPIFCSSIYRYVPKRTLRFSATLTAATGR